jgi:hypothetical protein
MRSLPRHAVLLVCLGLHCAVGYGGQDQTSDEYQKQQDKLSRETGPIGKVKVLIKMSDLDLNNASHRVKKGNLLEADRFLKRYTEVIKQINQTLKGSSRNAQKDPSGFKDFEIALRRQLRKLADLKLNYSFDQQEAINQAITMAESAKEQMFQAIFGPENAARRKDRNATTEKGKQESH